MTPTDNLKPRQFERTNFTTLRVMNNQRNIYTIQSQNQDSFMIEDLLNFLGYKRLYDEISSTHLKKSSSSSRRKNKKVVKKKKDVTDN